MLRYGAGPHLLRADIVYKSVNATEGKILFHPAVLVSKIWCIRAALSSSPFMYLLSSFIQPKCQKFHVKVEVLGSKVICDKAR